MENRKLKILNWTMAIFFFCQTFFSICGDAIWHTQNFYPFYTWKIFHTRPDKYLTSYWIGIHGIDGKIYDPPIIDLNFVEKEFPSLRKYTLARKLNDYGTDHNKDSVLQNLNEMFLQDHSRVEWSVFEVNYDPIELYWEKKIKSKREMERQLAKKEN